MQIRNKILHSRFFILSYILYQQHGQKYIGTKQLNLLKHFKVIQDIVRGNYYLCTTISIQKLSTGICRIAIIQDEEMNKQNSNFCLVRSFRRQQELVIEYQVSNLYKQNLNDKCLYCTNQPTIKLVFLPTTISYYSPCFLTKLLAVLKAEETKKDLKKSQKDVKVKTVVYNKLENLYFSTTQLLLFLTSIFIILFTNFPLFFRNDNNEEIY